MKKIDLSALKEFFSGFQSLASNKKIIGSIKLSLNLSRMVNGGNISEIHTVQSDSNKVSI